MTERPRTGRGRVSSFDREVGLGTVTSDDGVDVGFHCTRIADGSRDIAVGTAVTFEVVAGRRGSWEAAEVTPSPAVASSQPLR